MILAGDIGGTNVRLALFEIESGALVQKEERKFRSGEVQGLEGPVETFLAGRRVLAAGFGVAGPVRNGRCEATNLPWVVDAASLAGQLALPRVALVNDLLANALGLSELSGDDFAVVNAGTPDGQGTAALISAGTGLGEAYLVRVNGRLTPQASEGGHASFAPRNPFEIDLLRHLHRTHSHVSFERILSGPGLAALYAYERSCSQVSEPAWLTAEIAAAGDASPAVTAAALAGKDPVAARALEHFVSIYGGEAGNLALKVLATGGVFVGGGIAPRILPKLLDGTFFGAFCDKGRFAPLLAKIPIRVVTNDRCALLGAARAGAEAAYG
jgi:glucokinase